MDYSTDTYAVEIAAWNPWWADIVWPLATLALAAFLGRMGA